MSTVRSIAKRLGQWLVAQGPKKTSRRSYASARSTRGTGGFGGSNTSADAELLTGLTALRSRSRQMVRDSAYAKRAKAVIVNNVIGGGVGLQAQVKGTRDTLRADVNTQIEEAFCSWGEPASCHTGGALHFHDLERAALGQVFEAGEVFIRKHYSAMGESPVPLTLELIEAERLSDGLVEPGSSTTGNEVRMGVEVDKFGRAVAYWIRPRHPGDVRLRGGGPLDMYERVPAEHVFHLRVVDRWPQTRGEPWMHTAVRKLDELNEYTSLEVQAARGSAAYFATITTPDPESPSLQTDDTEGDKPVMDLEPLTIQELAPGEELHFHTPNRPNTALDPFMRAMLREVAAGIGVSYSSLSRDYSQGTYSSERQAMLEDRDHWKSLQLWWIRNFRHPLHKAWLRQAVLARAVQSIRIDEYALNTAKFEAVRFKPRGWSWIDPTKEVTAYKEAIRGGLTSLSSVIAATADGRDIEDVIEEIKRDHELLEAAGVTVDTVVEAAMPAPAPQPAAADPSSPDPSGDPSTTDTAPAPARVVPMRGRA